MLLERNGEMNSTLTSIDQRKKEEWHKKITDTSNKELSVKLLKEKERQKAELNNNVAKSKQVYHLDLAAQKREAEKLAELDRNKHRRIPGEREGFEFE